MRFPILTKTTLFAASLFFASAAWSHAQTITHTQTGVSLANGEVTIDTSNGSFTVDGEISGAGKIIVEGENVLEFLAGVNKARPSLPPYFTRGNARVETTGSETTIDNVVRELPWISGELVVNEGIVNLKGYINLWLSYGSTANTLLNFPAEGKMGGVNFVTLNGSARLNVGNSAFDSQKDSKIPQMIPGSKNVFVTLNNLRAGEDNSQSGTILDVGRNNASSDKTINGTYHVNFHVDAWDGDSQSTKTLEHGGSVGTIIGDANIYKTGAGNFKLLNENSAYTGNFYAAGGNLLLGAGENNAISVDDSGVLARHGYDLAYGRTLWEAKSLTIAGAPSTSSISEGSRMGYDVGGRMVSTNYANGVQVTQYAPAYFASPSAGTVVVKNNQVIRNFQAMFANGAEATDSNLSAASAIKNAAETVDKAAPIIAGTGGGSYLAVKEGSTLAICQESGMGGIYKGTICGVNEAGTAAGVSTQTGALEKGGTIVKYGEGDLALMLEGANYEKLALLQGGNVVVNITAIDLEIGSYDWGNAKWAKDSGLLVGDAVRSFTIVENVAATLKMRLDTEDVHFSTYAFVTTAGKEIDVSDNRQPGYVELTTEQRFITGEVFAEGGMTLVLTAEDLAGEDLDTDGDGVADRRRYYDINGAGTFTKDGTKYALSYYKDLTNGERVYYYTDESGVEIPLSASEVKSEAFQFEDYVKFSGGSVANAKAVILAGTLSDTGSADAVRSTLSFNNTNQKINNLTGDLFSGVQLGTSTLTLNITDSTSRSGEVLNGGSLLYSTYLGSISGVGNIIKTGAERLTLGGGSSLSYMGATVVAEGSMNVTRSQSLWNSSAVLMDAGTGISFVGAQNLVALIGGDAKVALDDGELRLGMDASRRSDLASASKVEAGDVLGVTIVNNLGNSSEVLKIYSKQNALVEAYLKPLLDFVGKEVAYTDDEGKAQTRVVLTNEQATALKRYFQGESFSAVSMETLFGRTVDSGTLTVADITRLYARLMAETQFGAEFDTKGNLASADLKEMIERLSFNGSVTANSILKVGNDRATLAGKVEAKSLNIVGGVLEIDTDVAASDKTFSEGIKVGAGATFAINTTGVEGEYSFDKNVSGDGNFEKLGEGHLVLSDNVAYLGTTTLGGGDLTMSIRAVENSTFDQGDIFVTNRTSTLYLNQVFTKEDDQLKEVTWDGSLNNAGNLVKQGNGKLTLTTAASIGGDLSVETGTLVLTDADLTDSAELATLSVASGATLELSESETATIDRLFSGAGTLIKSGEGELALKTSNFGEKPQKFSGVLQVSAGTLAWETANMFDAAASVDVREGATLKVNADQTIKMLAGNGNVEINTASAVSLNVALSNQNALSYDNRGSAYVTTVNGVAGTDYSSFDVYSGTISTVSEQVESKLTIGGAGALVFAGEVTSDKIDFTVAENATLVTSTLDLNVEVKDKGRVILASNTEDAKFTGKITGEEGRVIGKIGSGTVTMVAKQSNPWNRASLEVLEGTLRLEGSSAFSFASATVVEGATLALTYTSSSVPDLSSIEGSGTVKLEADANLMASSTLELTKSSMLAPLANAEGKYFNGILDVGALNLIVQGKDVVLCAIATEGQFETYDKVTIYQGKDTTIQGAFSGNIEVIGAGKLNLASENATGTILVNNGNVAVNANAKELNNGGGLCVKNDASVHFTETSSVKDGFTAVEVRMADNASVGKVSLLKGGEDRKSLDFTAVEDGGKNMLGVADDDLWTALTGENRGKNAQLALGVSQGELTLAGLADLNSAVALTTQDAGTLVFHAEDGTETLNRSVYGNGNVAFRGSKGTKITVNQAYTGTTTVEAGAVVEAQNISLATSDFVVEEGATLKGGVKLVGQAVASTVKSAQANTADKTIGGNFSNSGTVVLNVNNGDVIEYAGAFENTGTIQLTGARAATRGNEIILFKSLSGKTYTNKEMETMFGGGKLTNGSSALMISQTNAGVISAFSVGSSFASLSGLHDGLAGSYTNVLDLMSGVDDAKDGIVFESDLQSKWGAIGVALNRASADTLASDVTNLSPIGMASMVAMSRAAFSNDWSALSARMSHRRYDSGNELMENGPEFFARAHTSLVDNAKDASSANFDFNTYGAIVGIDVKPDDFSLYGFALGYDYGSAKLHNNGGDVHSDSFRATAFASGLIGDGTFFLDGAVHVGMNSYDIDRKTLVGDTKGDTDGWNAGFALSFGKGFLLNKSSESRLLITPYIDLSYLYTKVDSFDESGTAALDVDAFDAQSLRGRLGATLDWQIPLGEWDARLSLDIAYSHEFIDDEAEMDARFVANREKFSVDGIIGSSDTFSFSPSMTIDLSEHDSLSFGYTLEYGTDEQVSHSLNAGFRRCF